jgi:hypothetical protein
VRGRVFSGQGAGIDVLELNPDVAGDLARFMRGVTTF